MDNILLQAQALAQRDAARDMTIVRFKNIANPPRMVEGVLPGGVGEMPRWRYARSSAAQANPPLLTEDLTYPMPAPVEGSADPTPTYVLLEVISMATTEEQLRAMVPNGETREPVIEAAKNKLLEIRESERRRLSAAPTTAPFAPPGDTPQGGTTPAPVVVDPNTRRR